ncbi:hypothetical protein ACMU_08725 [Actibacterium mucosum KCTC 23349]|uniref:Uncharacterized protein n=1 Tax=Actibacterium mucosum KCTC 23349 TaxID=1454373 RepID=A0A037ZJW9_9RHOB|nr:DUF4169 family protein [Actibacterium mucosum]KAJ55847.1 hypothetical protein ACMU_08725 [Actibacterium mucosum KCTC 23349]
MSKPINLRAARKARARDAKRAQGDENAAKFGQTKAEKARNKSEQAAQVARLDSHKRDDR